VAEALGLDPEILGHDLVDKSGETKPKNITSKTFPFGLPQDECPAQSTDAVNEIFYFHKGTLAGNDPLVRPKRRSTKGVVSGASLPPCIDRIAS